MYVFVWLKKEDLTLPCIKLGSTHTRLSFREEKLLKLKKKLLKIKILFNE
jgi:hypothetical protein